MYFVFKVIQRPLLGSGEKINLVLCVYSACVIMRGSRKALVIVISVVIVLGFAYILSPVQPASIGYLSNLGGFYHVSEIQTAPSNESYSVIFHNVNFTFLYWCWSIPSINGSPIPAEQTVYLFVQLSFSDDSVEIIEISIHSSSTCIIGGNPYLRGSVSIHTQPRAGVASAYTEELVGNWVYLVSFP